jgi:hypothetical protein
MQFARLYSKNQSFICEIKKEQDYKIGTACMGLFVGGGGWL